VPNNQQAAGKPAADALASGLGATALLLAISCFAGTALVATLRRTRLHKMRTVDIAAAAAAAHHTIPLAPASETKVPVAV
jgi:hypothetical protein